MRRLLTFLAFLICAQPAGAINYCDGLDKTISTAIWDFDVTCANSYSGSPAQTGVGAESQFLRNLVVNPADANPRAKAIFVLGSSAVGDSNDPAFNGTIGDSGAYLSFDGTNDYLTWSNAPGLAVTSWLDKRHQAYATDKVTANNSQTTICTAFRFDQNDAVQGIFGNSATTAVAGFNLNSTAAEGASFVINTGNGVNGRTDAVIGAAGLVDGTDYILCETRDSDDLTWKLSLNSDTFALSGTSTALTTFTQSTFTSVAGATNSIVFAAGDPVANGMAPGDVCVLAGTSFNNTYTISAFGGVSNRTLTVSPDPGIVGADTSFSWACHFNYRATTGFFTWGAANGSASFPVAAATRFYGIYAFQGILSNAEVAAVRDVIQARHGRAY